MRFAKGLTLTVVLLPALAASGQETERAEFLSARPDLILNQSQAWGELGIDKAVHAAGQPAMPLQIGDKKYKRGLGHHAPGEIVVGLEGEFATFKADVGLQPLPNAPGTVVFQVFVDDEKRFDSGVMRTGEAAKPVSIPVKGAQELRLVVTDAGDGINSDCANWAGARLIRDPEARPSAPQKTMDVARFGQVVTSDPMRDDGARRNRVQEFLADDLYLETDLGLDARGGYAVTATTDGLGCIGLNWIERRAIRGLALEFVEGFRPPAEDVRLQFWQGESRWQGNWKPFRGLVVAEGNRWTFRADNRDNPDMRGGTWKIRWIFPVGDRSVLVRRLTAFSPLRLITADLRIEFDKPRKGEVEIYNGDVVDTGETKSAIDAAVTPLKVRYCKPRTGQAERTVLRFRLDGGERFAVAVDDVLANEAVYVPRFGALVAKAEPKLDLAAYRAKIAGRKTVLEEVRAVPDQTFAQAIEHVHHEKQNLQPTMLSLACDNAKFIVHRDGVTQFTPAGDWSLTTQANVGEYPSQLKPVFGSGRNEGLSRHLEGGWYPAPVVTVGDGGVRYSMRSFVAPHSKKAAADNPWLDEKPLYVAEITMQSAGGDAEASLALAFLADAKQNRAAQVKVAERLAIITDGEHLMAAIDCAGSELRLSAEGGSVRLRGKLQAGRDATCRVCIPGWAMKADEAPTLAGGASPFAEFKAYWDRILASTTQVRTPDDLLNNIIRASQVHCLLAARNEENGRRIAPWIAAVSYGPLESESNSIIRGMALLGHSQFAQRSFDFFIQRYDPAGFLTTGYTLMGTGWHLQRLGEYHAIARDREWMKAVAPKVATICEWILKQRQKTTSPRASEMFPTQGLMPPGVMADWNAFAYHFCLNGYFYAGLKSAADALSDVGHPMAAAWQQNAADFRETILRAYRDIQAIAPVYPLRNGAWVPPYPAQLLPGATGPFFPGEDGNRSWCYDVEIGAHQLVPQGVLPVDSEDVAWMMDHMEDVQFLSSGWFDYPSDACHKDWYNLGGFAKVQPYYCRNGEICAMRSDVKPFVRTYFNTIPSLLGMENLAFQEHFNGVGAWNKTHETGYFLQHTRFMLVMEYGDALWLAPLVTNNWLKDGMAIDVKNAPTRFGPVSYTIQSSVAAGTIDAAIEPLTRTAPKRIVLRLRHPDGKPIKTVTVNGRQHAGFDASKETITLEPSGSRIDVRAGY